MKCVCYKTQPLPLELSWTPQSQHSWSHSTSGAGLALNPNQPTALSLHLSSTYLLTLWRDIVCDTGLALNPNLLVITNSPPLSLSSYLTSLSSTYLQTLWRDIVCDVSAQTVSRWPFSFICFRSLAELHPEH